MTSQTSVPQLSSCSQDAATIRPACSTVGGFGCGGSWLGFFATAAGFDVIQSHRTAADRAALIAKCTWRIVDRDSGQHSCGGHSTTVQPAFSQSCSG